MPGSGEHYIPRPDAEFGSWADRYVEAVETFWLDHGLDPAALNPLKDALAAWNAAYPAHVGAQAAAASARRNKDDARRALEARARPIARFLQAYAKTTDADRARIGITVRDASPTPARPPATRPRIVVEPAGRFTHALRLADESTPTRRGRPAGAERAELFIAFTPVGTPAPADPEAYRYVRSVTDGRAVLAFDEPRAGLQAHYLARWVSRRGGLGPWSETAGATVAA